MTSQEEDSDLAISNEADKRLSPYLFDLSWREVRDLLPTVKLAIIPTGSTEQHGPNGTLEVDTGRAREFSKRLGERLYPNALVTPCVQFGMSSHHMHFPGTITLSFDTYIGLLMDIATSLHEHGISRFLFLNGHGGNKHALGIVVARLRHELGVRAAWISPTSIVADIVSRLVKSETSGHACESEMSQCMYLCPQTVKYKTLEKGAIKNSALAKRYMSVGSQEGIFWEEVTENGALGDARLATYEMGQELVETSLERLEAYARLLMKEE